MTTFSNKRGLVNLNEENWRVFEVLLKVIGARLVFEQTRVLLV